MSRWFLISTLSIIVSFQTKGQTTNEILDRLGEITELHHHDSVGSCGDSLYWQIVQLDKAIIPGLIAKITDSTTTNILIPCTDDSLKIGDLAFIILDEIVYLPNAQISHSQWCLYDNRCEFLQPLGWFEYLNTNRTEFHSKLITWYADNEKKLKRRYLKEEYISSCQQAYGIEYQWYVK